MLTNGEPVIAGPLYIPGIRLYDAVSLMMSAAIAIVPFVLGMRVLGTPEAQTDLLRVLVLAACAYACLVLFEVRMSPQLSNWIYGFFPHSFLQHMRGGGFRPVVFLHHGLWLGMFLCMAVLGACTLWRQALRDRVQAVPWLAATLWLAVTLVLSRNLGATALMLLFAPVILFAPPRMQIFVAAVFAGMVLTYPMLRGAGLVPIDTIHTLTESVSEDRAQSLKFRFDHEDMLLARANEKPLAGWGSWGRNRVYDPETGRDLSVTDGIWVITIGSFGWFGYLAQFGLLTMPILLLLRSRSWHAPATSGLAAALAANLVYLIPNSALAPIGWLAAGALAGTVISLKQNTTTTLQQATVARNGHVPDQPGLSCCQAPSASRLRDGLHRRHTRLSGLLDEIRRDWKMVAAFSIKSRQADFDTLHINQSAQHTGPRPCHDHFVYSDNRGHEERHDHTLRYSCTSSSHRTMRT